MALNEEKEIQDLMMEALERDPQRGMFLRAWPSAGMSHIHVSLLLRLSEKKEEPE